MRDLINIIYQSKIDGLTEQDTKKLIAIELHKALKQMSEEEFASCFASASINTKTHEYDISLRLPVVSN